MKAPQPEVAKAVAGHQHWKQTEVAEVELGMLCWRRHMERAEQERTGAVLAREWELVDQVVQAGRVKKQVVLEQGQEVYTPLVGKAQVAMAKMLAAPEREAEHRV